jgi:hypothetical protein
MDYKQFLKKFSGVSAKFIDDFFTLYDNESLPTDHVVDIEVVANYLGAKKGHIKLYEIPHTSEVGIEENDDVVIGVTQPHGESNTHQYVIIVNP